MTSSIFNINLIEKYSTQGPRYTSYPTAVEFTPQLDENRYIELLKESNSSGKDLSIYVHLPFCDTVCYYCACNKIITKNKRHAGEYLEVLEQEINMQVAMLDDSREVTQLHWGGGTPTFMSIEEQWQLTNLLRDNFIFKPDDIGEYSVEIDPRTTSVTGIQALREMGFNRLSFGVQDFDPRVQKAVNRIQSYIETCNVIKAGRKYGFHSISLDLIYGLPLQTVESFEMTIQKVIDLAPDRIAVFNYAHLPHLFKTQKQIKEHELPTGEVKLALLEMSIRRLTEAGYVFIGLDHFAKPNDSMVIHQNEGTLYRNFQGYSTFSNCDMIGFGMSSISMVGNSYSQNVKDKTDYYDTVRSGHLATVRGLELNQDDIIRRHAITELMCNMKLDLNVVSSQFDIDATTYFAEELSALSEQIEDGLLSIENSMLTVLPPGRLLIRNICMVFDKYLTQQKAQTFSKVI